MALKASKTKRRQRVLEQNFMRFGNSPGIDPAIEGRAAYSQLVHHVSDRDVGVNVGELITAD